MRLQKKTAGPRACLVLLGLCVAVGGCAGRPSLFPNPDKNLRRSSSQFAADAAARHPYKADAPRGPEAVARAEIDYGLKTIKLANLSDNDWKDVEVWVNKEYVVFVPYLAHGKMETIYFQSLYDGKGNYFPVHNGTVHIEKLELLMDGKMSDVKLALP